MQSLLQRACSQENQPLNVRNAPVKPLFGISTGWKPENLASLSISFPGGDLARFQQVLLGQSSV